jgi:hypothetical protein
MAAARKYLMNEDERRAYDVSQERLDDENATKGAASSELVPTPKNMPAEMLRRLADFTRERKGNAKK